MCAWGMLFIYKWIWNPKKGGRWRPSLMENNFFSKSLVSYKGRPLMATQNWITEVGIIQRVAVNGHPKLKQWSWHHTKSGRWRPPKTESHKLASNKGWPLTATHLKEKWTLVWVAVRSCSSLVAVARCMYAPTSPLGSRSSILFLHVARSCFFRVLLRPYLKRGCLKAIERVWLQEVRVSRTQKIGRFDPMESLL